jgi:hypothetical protein
LRFAVIEVYLDTSALSEDAPQAHASVLVLQLAMVAA